MYAILRRLRLVNRPNRLVILLTLALASFGGLCFQQRIPLGVDYHAFADQRAFVGIPRALDVLSNVLFLIVGAAGLKFLFEPASRSTFLEKQERLPYLLFFAGVALTGLGSAYYHLAPGDSRLPWDLLPMTLSFTSLFAATIMERVSVRAGLSLFPALVILGAASVEFWEFGQLRGQGDYRFYLFTQYFAVIAIAAMIILFPPRYTHTLDLFLAFVFYALAKIFELLDQQIYSLGRIASGHTLKHLSAGVACYWVLRMLKMRRATQFSDLASGVLEHANSSHSF
jgi:hypothetical protein